jgi:hypothetical protein
MRNLSMKNRCLREMKQGSESSVQKVKKTKKEGKVALLLFSAF